jgi:hypothetical protein
MKYTPIFVPVILILGLIAVRLFRPPPVEHTGTAPMPAVACEAPASCR